MKTNFISVKSSVYEFIRFIGHEGELDKNDLLAWANDAVSRIVTDEQLNHKVTLIDVKNYRAQLPADFKYVIQAAYKEKDNKKCTRESVSQWTQKILGTECDLEINLKCPKCTTTECSCGSPIVEVNADRLWKSSNPQYQAAYQKHFYSYGGNTMRGGGKHYQSQYHPQFKLMKHTNSSFFNVPYHISECININLDCEVEYNINMPNMIVNFKEGQVLLSYLGRNVDAEGYLMIPNEPVVIRAISYAMAERWSYRQFMRTGEQKDRIAFQINAELTEKWTARALSELQTPDYDEFSSFVKSFWHKVIPYWDHESNLNRNSKSPKFKYPGETRNPRGYDSQGGPDCPNC